MADSSQILSSPFRTLSLDDAVEAGATVISCADNPYDLRPAVEGIMERVERASASLRPGQPLVILMEECHLIPSHRVLQIMVLDRLNKDAQSGAGSSVACGMELPHNLLGILLERKMGYQLTIAQKEKISRNDHNGKRSLATLLAFTRVTQAPVAHHALLNFCLQQNISTRFNDAARTLSDNSFDSGDPTTQALIARYAPDESVPLVGILGMRLRNIAITEGSLLHIKGTAAKRYVLSAGMRHILGWNPDYRPYQDSLCARFEEAGAKVLPVLLAAPSQEMVVDNIPVDARIHLKDSVIITRVIDKKFTFSSSNEDIFIRHVAAQSGTEFSVPKHQLFMGLFDSSACRALKKHVREQAPQWIAELRNIPD